MANIEVGEKIFLPKQTSLDLTKNKINVITGYLGSSSISSIVGSESVGDKINIGMESSVQEIIEKLNTIPQITDFSSQSVTMTADNIALQSSGNVNVSVPSSKSGYYNNTSLILPSAGVRSKLGIDASKIAEGQSIAGVEGTFMGSTGTAVAADVLKGKTFSNSSSKGITGTMNDFSGYKTQSNSLSGTFSSGTTGYIYTKPSSSGYCTTSTLIKTPVANLSPENIASGVSVGGVVGTAQTLSSHTVNVRNGWSGYTGGTYTCSVCGSDGLVHSQSFTTTSGKGGTNTLTFENIPGPLIGVKLWAYTSDGGCNSDPRIVATGGTVNMYMIQSTSGYHYNTHDHVGVVSATSSSVTVYYTS